MGPIEVLISDARCRLESTVKESSMNDLDRHLDVNFFTNDAITKAMWPYRDDSARADLPAFTDCSDEQ